MKEASEGLLNNSRAAARLERFMKMQQIDDDILLGRSRTYVWVVLGVLSAGIPRFARPGDCPRKLATLFWKSMQLMWPRFSCFSRMYHSPSIAGDRWQPYIQRVCLVMIGL